jgi:hypothetical protein
MTRREFLFSCIGMVPFLKRFVLKRVKNGDRHSFHYAYYKLVELPALLNAKYRLEGKAEESYL